MKRKSQEAMANAFLEVAFASELGAANVSTLNSTLLRWRASKYSINTIANTIVLGAGAKATRWKLDMIAKHGGASEKLLMLKELEKVKINHPLSESQQSALGFILRWRRACPNSGPNSTRINTEMPQKSKKAKKAVSSRTRTWCPLERKYHLDRFVRILHGTRMQCLERRCALSCDV